MTINHGRIEADRGRGGKIPPIPPPNHTLDKTHQYYTKRMMYKKYVAPIGKVSGGDIIMFNYSCNDA